MNTFLTALLAIVFVVAVHPPDSVPDPAKGGDSDGVMGFRVTTDAKPGDTEGVTGFRAETRPTQ